MKSEVEIYFVICRIPVKVMENTMNDELYRYIVNVWNG